MTMIDYAAAGVNIAAGNETVNRIKKQVESTFSNAVLTGLGSFGALYDLSDIVKNYKNPVLVQSIDGVGTKIMLARLMNRYDSIGRDLVSATTNDIVVLGATPLTLLDYIANEKLSPGVVESIMQGMVAACRENAISLVGGETAEMPGTYLPGEHDLVGVITGVVEKDQVITGENIVPGDVIMAFPSSGLHTNGYSLARKLFFDQGNYTVQDVLPGFTRSLGDILLEPHLNYTQPIAALLKNNITIHGMAHITGGGLVENLPRILPASCAAEIHLGSWPVQAIFSKMQELGQITQLEMYRTFNMGVGLVVVLPREQAVLAQAILQAFPAFPFYEIGRIKTGEKTVEWAA